MCLTIHLNHEGGRSSKYKALTFPYLNKPVLCIIMPYNVITTELHYVTLYPM